MSARYDWPLTRAEARLLLEYWRGGRRRRTTSARKTAALEAAFKHLDAHELVRRGYMFRLRKNDDLFMITPEGLTSLERHAEVG